jgi:hypothetical protein
MHAPIARRYGKFRSIEIGLRLSLFGVIAAHAGKSSTPQLGLALLDRPLTRTMTAIDSLQ